MWRDDFDYYPGYGRGFGRGWGLGLGYGRRFGYGRGYGPGWYGRGYMTKEELKDFYNYHKKRLELELEELNKAIQDLDKE